MKLYTIYDKVAEEAGPIVTAKNDGIASRLFVHLVQKEGLNPVDYTLLFVADFDTTVSKVVGLEVPLEVPLNFSDVEA